MSNMSTATGTSVTSGASPGLGRAVGASPIPSNRTSFGALGPAVSPTASELPNNAGEIDLTGTYLSKQQGSSSTETVNMVELIDEYVVYKKAPTGKDQDSKEGKDQYKIYPRARRQAKVGTSERDAKEGDTPEKDAKANEDEIRGWKDDAGVYYITLNSDKEGLLVCTLNKESSSIAVTGVWKRNTAGTENLIEFDNKVVYTKVEPMEPWTLVPLVGERKSDDGGVPDEAGWRFLHGKEHGAGIHGSVSPDDNEIPVVYVELWRLRRKPEKSDAPEINSPTSPKSPKSPT